jgi:hypothetical protein
MGFCSLFISLHARYGYFLSRRGISKGGNVAVLLRHSKHLGVRKKPSFSKRGRVIYIRGLLPGQFDF